MELSFLTLLPTPSDSTKAQISSSQKFTGLVMAQANGRCFELDLSPDKATLTLDGLKWGVVGKDFQFLCLLIASDPDIFVSHATVHRLPAWSRMTSASVGKQVARRLAAWRSVGFEPVEFIKKTDGWKLASAFRETLAPEQIEVARAVLDSLGWVKWARFSKLSDSELSSWACQNIHALLGMTEGKAEWSYQKLRASYETTQASELREISDVLAARIGQRLPQPHLPIERHRGTWTSPLDLAIAARQQAAYAIRWDSNKWAAAVVLLEATLPQLMNGGDFTTQAIVLNALALLHRRLGEHTKALRHAKEAVPLAIFSGDFILMQSVVFNYGNILSEIQRLNFRPGTENSYEDLLMADLAIRDRLGVGMDSAQTELLLAYLNFESGAFEAAMNWVCKAKSIIQINRSPADSALALRIEGLIILSSAEADKVTVCAGLSLLESAMAEYLAMGNQVAADVVKAELIKHSVSCPEANSLPVCSDTNAKQSPPISMH